MTLYSHFDNQTIFDCFTDIADIIHRINTDKGWNTPGVQRPLPELMMLIISELAEIIEADRKGELNNPSDKGINYDLWNPHAKETQVFELTNLQEELADVFIRVVDMMTEYGVKGEHVAAKIRYNATRPHRHGKLY